MVIGLDHHHGGRLLSRPLKVHWAGWESDTFKLQQAGWQISAEQSVASNSMQLAIQSREWLAQGLSQRISDFDYHRGTFNQDLYSDIPIRFGMRLGREVVIHQQDLPEVPWGATDAMPQWSHTTITRLEDLAHFAVPPVRTQEIILPEEEDVNALLSRILEKQQGARQRYFTEQIAREHREGSLRETPRVHAQIITLRPARAA